MGGPTNQFLKMDDIDLRESLKDIHEACFGWATVCCRGDRDLAADVLHSVYVAVLEGRAIYLGRSEFRTWIFGVIRNVARDSIRGRWWSRVVRLDIESIFSTANGDGRSDVNLDSERRQVVRDALQQLPSRQREIIHLVFFEQLTIEKAAKVMKTSTGTARQHYSRGKSALRRKLDPIWNPNSKLNCRGDS